jgi:hypothetical protein
MIEVPINNETAFLAECKKLKEAGFIFRGQKDDLPMETSLQRLGIVGNITPKGYYMAMQEGHKILKKDGKIKRDLPQYVSEDSYFPYYNTATQNGGHDNSVAFTLSLLRHYGFPTPVLDWSASYKALCSLHYWVMKKRIDFCTLIWIKTGVDGQRSLIFMFIIL